MPTTHASQSITRDQPPFWYCAAGVPGLSTTAARPSRPYLEPRLVHPAWIFMHNRRHRMCVSATDCVTDACACSSLASRFLHARARAPTSFSFLLRVIVLRNELFAAMQRSDTRGVCQIVCYKTRGSTRFEVDRKGLYFGRVPSPQNAGDRLPSRFGIKRAENALRTLKSKANGSCVIMRKSFIYIR